MNSKKFILSALIISILFINGCSNFGGNDLKNNNQINIK